MLLAFVSLALAGATFVLVASPADLIRDRLIAQVQVRTGRDLVVKGGASLTLFPSLGVVMREVEMPAPAGMVSPPTLRAETATARIAWRPLMEGRIAVRAVSLARPVLDLAVDADGRRNWDFAAVDDRLRTAPIRLAQFAPRFSHGQGVPPELYEALEKSASRDARSKMLLGGAASRSLQEVSLTDGTIRYSDARSGSKREIAGVDLRIAFDGHKPAKISGSSVWAGEKVAFDGELQPREDHGTGVAVRVSARPFEATLQGVALASTSADFEGQIAARAPSAAVLTRWLGKSASGFDPNGPVALDAKVKASGSTWELSSVTATLADATATGSINIEAARQRPLIRADLKVSQLDLDRHLLSGARAAHDGPTASAADAGAGTSGSIDDLLRRTEDQSAPSGTPSPPPVRGSTRRAEEAWNSEPIDPGMLHVADIAGRLEIARLSWRQVKMGAARVNVTLDGAKLRADIEDAELYGGRGRAVLTVHAEGPAVAVGLTASLEQITALALMRDVAGFDWVDGRGRLSLALATQGASEREMVERLNGQAEFVVADGAVIGWNVTHMLRKLRQGQMTAVERDPSMKTPFNELAGSFTVAGGVAHNQDLRLTGSAVQLTGAGSVALPQRTVDYTVRPKLAIATAASSGAADPLSIELPVRIHGSWAHPKLAADLQGVLNDPRTAETVQQIGRQLRSGNVDEAVKGLLGGGPEAEEKAAKAKEFLKRFLKQ